MLTIQEVSVKNVRKTYKNHQVSIRELSFTKAITIIKGENGSGKSTLLKAMASLISYEGEIVKPVRVGFMQEEVSLPLDISLKLFLSSLRSIGQKTSQKRLDYFIDLFSLREKLEDKLGALSKGMRMKVNLIQCLMEEKDLYLLDEPFSGLDKKSVRTLVSYMHKQTNKKFIVTSHIFFDVSDLDCEVLYL